MASNPSCCPTSVPKADSLTIASLNALWSHLFHTFDAVTRTTAAEFPTTCEDGHDGLAANPTMHTSTGDLGLGQEVQQYGAEASEMSLCRSVGNVARTAEG